MRHYSTFDKNDVLPDEFVNFSGNYDVSVFLKKQFSFLYFYFTDPDYIQNVLQKAGKQHNISVKLIMTFLQAVSGILTMKNPPEDTNKLLNWVLKIGGNQTTSPSYGFEGQVMKFAQTFRELMEKAGSQIGYEIVVDDKDDSVFPINRVTCVLYRFDPYVGDKVRGERVPPYGNYLIWKTWGELFPEDFYY